MNKYYGVILFLFSGIGSYSVAQNVMSHAIVWQSDRSFDLASGMILVEESDFITFRTDSILWRDKRGTGTKKFLIEKTRGAWPSISTPGELSFDVVMNDRHGVIVVRKTNLDTRIRILLIGRDDSQLTELLITKTQILQ